MSKYKVRRMGFVCACFVLAGTVFALVKWCLAPADSIAYNKFLDKVHITMSGRGKTPYCAEQLRQGVSREIWYASGTQRLKVFLTANEAEVAYEGIDRDMEIVEHLRNVKGWLQEKLYQQENVAMQSVRYLEADGAFYRNAKRVICADNVLVNGYRIPSHQLSLFDPEQMEADSSLSAQSLELRLLDKTAKLEGDVSFQQKSNEACQLSFNLHAQKVSAQMGEEQTIFLEEDVKSEYDGKWHAKADYGLYHCNENNSDIILWSEKKPCEASSIVDKIQIRSEIIEAFPKRRCIEFLEPKGAICLKGEGDRKEELQFSSNTMKWENESKECILNGSVAVALPSRNILLTTDKTLRIKKGEKGIEELRSIGNTVVTCEGEEKDFIVTCGGDVLLDHTRHLLRMERAADGEQLFFRDGFGKIYADRAELDYQTIDQKIVPLKIVFTGNVLVFNREPPLLQRALADRLTLFFPTSELFFAANPHKRVLFYDQANNLEISAKGVKVKRDKVTKKDSVQGLGDMRFSFDEEEFTQLKKRFLLEEDVLFHKSPQIEDIKN